MCADVSKPSTLKTPDFGTYPTRIITDLIIHPLGLEVSYNDGKSSFHLTLNLREHSPDSESTHPITRETLIAPIDIPEDLTITDAHLRKDGFVAVTWSKKITPNDSGCSVYHPGWLYQTGLSDDIDFKINLEQNLWDAVNFNNIPKSDGACILDDYNEFLEFLINLVQFGVVIIRDLPIQKDILEKLTSKIGTIRSSNFGWIFDVKTHEDADSNAYTNVELPAHNDLSTREYVPGLQFLYCLENNTDGGFSTLTDGFSVAHYLKETDPDIYRLLLTQPVNFASKGQTSDYRIRAPLFHHNEKGNLDEIRWTCWLRAPLRGSFEEMDKTYHAQREFYRLVNDSKFKVEFKLEPGDMMCIDNRRVLHGRTSFTESSGARWVRGCYMERDELWSALRVALRARHS